MKLVVLCALMLAACGSSPEAGSCTRAACPSGGHTYQFCSLSGACSYISSDGKTFKCGDCGDCGIAAAAVAAWCSAITGGTTGSTTGTGGTTSGTTTGGAPDMSHTTIGATCTTVSDCRDGVNPTCRKSTTALTGMCTADCTTDADCGAGNVCLFGGGSDPGACARTCASAADCGNDLGCWITLGPLACWPRDGIAEFGQPLGLNCDPTVAACTFPGTGGRGGCDRQVLGPGNMGVCRQGCDIGTGECPSILFSGMTFTQSCYFVDETFDMTTNQPNGDKLKAPICEPDFQVGTPAAFIADGAECLDPDSNMHFFDICVPGSQCETYDLTGAAADNRCHRLCYLGSFMPRDLGVPDAGVTITCPSGQTCHDVFGTGSSSLPVGLCK